MESYQQSLPYALNLLNPPGDRQWLRSSIAGEFYTLLLHEALRIYQRHMSYCLLPVPYSLLLTI